MMEKSRAMSERKSHGAKGRKTGSKGTKADPHKAASDSEKSCQNNGRLNIAEQNLPFLNPNYVRPTKFKSLKQITNIEKNVELPEFVPTYWNTLALPSVYPQKKFCDITGLEAIYTDPQTTLRYHNSEVYHFIRALQPHHIQHYLDLRKAALDLK